MDAETFDGYEYDAWTEYGQARGFVGPEVCWVEDGLPTTEAEDEYETPGGDEEQFSPCVHVRRLYPDDQTRSEIEAVNDGATSCTRPFVLSAEATAWSQHGEAEGWVGPIVCDYHDGVPVSAAESEQAEECGEFSCLHIIRHYADSAMRDAVEANHSPSQWRRRRG